MSTALFSIPPNSKPKAVKARKRITKAVLWLMCITRGEALAGFWAWEMTPMPAGLPSWRQIRIGAAMAFGLDFIASAYQRSVQRKEAAVIDRWKASHGVERFADLRLRGTK